MTKNRPPGVLSLVWQGYWKLEHDPFLGRRASYVPLPGHEEAAARLVDAIESGDRLTVLRGDAGVGKSQVLARVLKQVRNPTRRVVCVTNPIDGASLLAGLAAGLGVRMLPSASRSVAWKLLSDAVRVCRWQRLRVVLAIDDCQELTDPSGVQDIERLVHLDVHLDASLSVVQVFRNQADSVSERSPWELSVELAPLTRTGVEHYLTGKLAAAGRAEPTFSPRAVSRLYSLSEGVPRTLDRLAQLALMAGAVRGLEMVSPELVEGVSQECAAGRSLV